MMLLIVHLVHLEIDNLLLDLELSSGLEEILILMLLLNNDVTVNNSLTVKGDFVVNGVQTVVQSNVLEVADKNIELAKVVSTQFTCATTDGSANITAISPTLGLIPAWWLPPTLLVLQFQTEQQS